jgi:uncharacterized protein
VNRGPAFHAGEQSLQARVGVRDRMAQIGHQVMRDQLPDQHRTFFAELPFLVVGSLDAGHQPWASVLANPPGFVQASDPRHLHIRARALPGDPLQDNVRDGAPLALLGLQPHTRRRNRLNGRARLVADGMSVEVGQSYGNCPKYIQAREPVFLPDTPGGTIGHEGPGLDAAARALVRAADTFFMATAHPDAAMSGSEPRHGLDVSHRGGKPGFVRVEGDLLTVPDFAGNQMFNTLGNIALHPLAGLLFVDFDTGDRLHLAVRAEGVWHDPVIADFHGAERLLRMEVIRARRVVGGLPLRWGPAVISPHALATGEWPS